MAKQITSLSVSLLSSGDGAKCSGGTYCYMVNDPKIPNSSSTVTKSIPMDAKDTVAHINTLWSDITKLISAAEGM